MKIKTPKLRITCLLQRQLKLAVMILLCFSFSGVNSQIVEYLDNGEYKFNTEFPTSDLHFYLFDDGYHSFDKDPIHQYYLSAVPASPVLFHTIPYNDDDPDEFIFTGINDGAIAAESPVYQFENQIEIKRSWNLVEEKENYFLLMFENSISSENISGCVEFHYNNSDLEISNEEILDDYGNHWVENKTIVLSEYEGYTSKIRWDFFDLMPNEQRFVYIPARCLKSVFSKIDTRGVMKINNCEEYIPENSKNDGSNEGIVDSKIYTLESIVSNFPHDPNYIVTDPSCLITEFTTQTIKYRIYFQNDGIHPVENVNIDISSFGELNIENIKLADASHTCNLAWTQNTFEIDFFDIFLPGMGQIPEPLSIEETIGWVELELCFYFDNFAGQNSECYNTVGRIKFDNQPPLSISNSICRDAHCEINVINYYGGCPSDFYYQEFKVNNGAKRSIENSIESFDEIYIRPNVSSSTIKISGLSSSDLYEVSIFSASGGYSKNVKIKNLDIIDISDLPQGIYYLNVKGSINNKTLPFVKI